MSATWSPQSWLLLHCTPKRMAQALYTLQNQMWWVTYMLDNWNEGSTSGTWMGVLDTSIESILTHNLGSHY